MQFISCFFSFLSMKGGTTGKPSGSGKKTGNQTSNTTKSQSKRNRSKPTGKVDKKHEKEYGPGKDDGPKTTTNKKKQKVVQEESVEKPVYKNKEFPTTTKPSGQRGGKPSGERTTNKPNANSEFKRSIKRENEAADTLANEGYKVEQNPVVKGKDPDYRIEGKIFDCYSPKTNNARSIAKHVSDKVAQKQTKRVVLNLADSDVQRHMLRKTLNDNPIGGLKKLY